MLKEALIVGLGGFIGSASRFLLSQFINKYFNITYPLGTLIINLFGCFLIGIILGLFEKENIISPNLNLFLTVGICGGFTTFSTFSNDSLILFNESDYLGLTFYMGISIFFGILLTFVGRHLVNYLWK
ncbi:MAG: fluoride efflux transporter CrcB [Candidatus Kapabacteria bacterium]|nr:fluoride efflux transporter CrcB [Candidatus Kapabacteria bacterium]